MLDRVARLPEAPYLLARGTRLGRRNSFLPCRQVVPAFSGLPRWGEFFRSYHLPVLSAEPNDSQSEEINVIEESRAENRSVPVQLGSWNMMEKGFLGRPFSLLCLAAAQKITHAAHWLSLMGELHVKAGCVSSI